MGASANREPIHGASTRLRPLRFGPKLYIAHTQPGFEPVAAAEVAARVEGAREVARRTVAGRAGMTVFFAPRPDQLNALRTVEDVFALVGYGAAIRADRALEAVRTLARRAPYVGDALAARLRVIGGGRAGRRLRFRVIARLVGSHSFRRSSLEEAIARGILERGDHAWRLSAEDRADVEFWATMLENELMLAVRLSDERMRHRAYKAAHRPASLRPSVAAALAWLSEPSDDDVVLDPFCGAGTILIERAHLGRYRMLYGGDSDPEALAAARQNIGSRYKPIELGLWDASTLPLGEGSVTKIVSNLPWGMRSGSHDENRRLYPRWIAEMKRVLTPGGMMVMLSAESGLMERLLWRGELAPSKVLKVSILGARATVYVCPRRPKRGAQGASAFAPGL